MAIGCEGRSFSNNYRVIWLIYSSTNAIIYNNITNNAWYGIYSYISNSNSIHHNNIINNNAGGVQAYDNTGTNYWNDTYPSGGNYWLGWITPDYYSGPNQDQPGADGIMDNPYHIDGGVARRIIIRC